MVQTFLLCISLIFLAGCSTALGTAGVVVGSLYGATFTALGLGAHDNELDQLYYLGTFDPQGQVPPSIYRIRVQGYSTVLSQMKFASGWVPASLVDPLNTTMEFIRNETDDSLSLRMAGPESDFNEIHGRKLILFGPEGFREAPQNQRLVIVMGADPSAFFKAIDKAHGKILSTLAEKKLLLRKEPNTYAGQ